MTLVRSTCLAAVLLSLATIARAQSAPAPLVPMQGEVAAAERALADDERQMAESHFRGALYAGWMLLGAVAAAEHRYLDAREAFTHASSSVVDTGDALQSLAIVHLQLNDAAAAIPILTRLTATRPKQSNLKRLLAQALIAARQPADAMQVLEEAHAAAPDDLETTFALASACLRVKKPDAARALFTQLIAARPGAETYVLVGRAYRDARMYGDARTALMRALSLNPRVRHAHYYLGTAALMEEGIVRLDEAIAAFRRELAVNQGDPASTALLGMALVEARNERDALPLLEASASASGATWRTFQYLGRCQLALGRARDAVAAFRKAIASSADVPIESRTGNLHYQLAQALRAAGDDEGATAEFAAAAANAADRADTSRDALARYLSEGGDWPAVQTPDLSLESPLRAMTDTDRRTLRARTADSLARIYLNLGVMQAQAGQFARAADFLESGAQLNSAVPQLQYSLGVAAFNAQQYAKAAAALERALAEEPGNTQARRMLALASLNTDAFARAVELLRDDPDRQRDASLQYAYGVALVHSGHAAEAEKLFSTLLGSHADSPELNVLLGEAYAEQGDFDGAIAALTRALTLKPDVRDANRTLGLIYMKRGRLSEAAAALQAELATHPADLRARYTLATVLDLDNRQAQALEELARLLRARPNDPDARYLTGKILLSRGAAAEAIEHLEIASRLAAQDANVQYQLGQAYQKLGRTAEAERAFERFRTLKEQRRGGGR